MSAIPDDAEDPKDRELEARLDDLIAWFADPACEAPVSLTAEEHELWSRATACQVIAAAAIDRVGRPLADYLRAHPDTEPKLLGVFALLRFHFSMLGESAQSAMATVETAKAVLGSLAMRAAPDPEPPATVLDGAALAGLPRPSRWRSDGYRACDRLLQVSVNDSLACTTAAVRRIYFRRTPSVTLGLASDEVAACAEHFGETMAFLSALVGREAIHPRLWMVEDDSGFVADGPGADPGEVDWS